MSKHIVRPAPGRRARLAAGALGMAVAVSLVISGCSVASSVAGAVNGAQAGPQEPVDDRRGRKRRQRNEPGDQVVGNTRPGLGLQKAVVNEMDGDQTERAQREQRLHARRLHGIAETIPLGHVVDGDAHRSSVSPSARELNAGRR